MSFRCSRCGTAVGRRGYCKGCHAAYMREWRKTYQLPPDARRRASARSKLNVYVRRGKVRRQPCEVCGETDVEAHHPDYEMPLVVNWLCWEHRLAVRRGEIRLDT